MTGSGDRAQPEPARVARVLFATVPFVTAQYAIRHVGAPLLGALRAERRILEQRAGVPAPGSPTG